MIAKKRILLLLLLMSQWLLPAVADEIIVDITSHFNYCWNEQEKQTHHADGSITYQAKTWGGLVYWVDKDWTDYKQLVVEFVEPAPVDVQPILQYEDEKWDGFYTRKGATEAVATLNSAKRHYVRQVALQAAAEATLHIRRIYLVKEEEEESDPQEEQDARLMVNELMQSNIDCVMDDLKDFPDSWVELYNGGTTSARLSRYRLGLTPDIKESSPLPSLRVAAGGRVLVYCDKVGDGLHLPFRLESGKGSAVYLFRDGQLVDYVSGLKKQPAPNISYGRSSDGADEWGYQLTPTPNTPNAGGICSHDHLLGDPVFSQSGRVFTDSPTFQLALTAPDGSPVGTEVRYTTDGTEPTRQSTLYTHPLNISTTTVIRAKLFCEGWLSPRSTTHSYILFPHQLTLPVVSIATDDSYLNDAKTGIFANNSGEKRNDWRRPINIEFFFDGENTPSNLNQLCETRVAGAASRGFSKKSMAIYAHKRFGTKRFEYEFFPDQCPGLTDYKSLMLRNAGNDFDYLYMRDAIVQRAMATYQDLDWQAWRPAIVYINGQYHCMLNIRERGNEDNVYTHYDGLEDIDLIENWGDLKEGTWDAYNQFKAFYSEQGHTLAEYEQWMDCEEFANLMAMNLFFCNLDFPGNNIIMWRPRTEGGRWRWIAKDCDYTMGIYGDRVEYNILEWLYNPNYDGNRNWGANSSSATRLFRRLMDDPDFRRLFIDRTAIYLGDILSERKVRQLMDAMFEQIKYEYPFHRELINRWWPNYYDELGKALLWLSKRPAIFYQQLADFYQLGSPIPMTVNGKRADAPIVNITFNGVRLSEGLFNGKFFPGREITLSGEAEDGKEVTGWKVLQVAGAGTITQYEVNGPQLTMTMPQCLQLVLTPITGDDSAIADVETPQWSWQWNGGQLCVSGAEAGTRVSIYDLRGILQSSAVSEGTDVLMNVSKGRNYILKVGEVSKIVCR